MRAAYEMTLPEQRRVVPVTEATSPPETTVERQNEVGR
jgi:hypothetical protein